MVHHFMKLWELMLGKGIFKFIGNFDELIVIYKLFSSYSYPDFSYICPGSDRKGCQDNLDTAQDFEITYQSNFIKVSKLLKINFYA